MPVGESSIGPLPLVYSVIMSQIGQEPVSQRGNWGRNQGEKYLRQREKAFVNSGRHPLSRESPRHLSCQVSIISSRASNS